MSRIGSATAAGSVAPSSRGFYFRAPLSPETWAEVSITPGPTSRDEIERLISFIEIFLDLFPAADPEPTP